MPPIKIVLAASALVVALGSAAFSKRPAKSVTPPADGAVSWAPNAVEPFALAKLLSEAPPDTLVVALDAPRHELRGSVPMAALAASDDSFVANRPRARRVILAGFDQIRADRLARRLLFKGVEARVLLGGLDAWDRTMDADPATPAPNANDATWRTYREHVALRHAFGEASLAPAAPLVAPAMPIAPAEGGAPKKREGC